MQAEPQLLNPSPSTTSLGETTTKIDLDGFKEKLLRRTKSQRTVDIYMQGVEKFETFCKEKLSKSLQDEVNDLEAGRADVYKVLDQFVGWLTARSLMPGSVQTITAGLKKFLRYHGVDIINERFADRVTMPVLAEIPDIPLEKPVLRKLLISSMPLPMRVAIGIMSSSGSRIGETSQLKVSDIHFDEDPVRIHFRAPTTKATKKGRFDRDTFITPEVAEMAKSYIETKHRGPDDRLFPKSYRPDGFRAELKAQLKKLGMDQKLPDHPFYQIHPHVFRKYFSRLADPIVGITARNALTGHTGYLDTYTKKPLHERQDDYRKLIPVLSVLQATSEEEQQLKTIETTLRTMGLTPEQVKGYIDELRQKHLFELNDQMMTRIRDELAGAWGLAPTRRPQNAGVW